MIIENYKYLIVKKNNINYSLFKMAVNNPKDIALLGYVFRVNREGKEDCKITSGWVGITENTLTIINNKKYNEEGYSKGKIKVYYPNLNARYLFESYENMKIVYHTYN